MTKFAIEFDPAIPAPPHPLPTLSLEDVTPRTEYYDEVYTHDVWYMIDGKKYCYYPASILTVFFDLFHEWELAKKRETHYMALSGYTILQIVFENGLAYFFDPVERSSNPETPPVADAVPADVIENSFKFALDAVWFKLKKIDSQLGSSLD